MLAAVMCAAMLTMPILLLQTAAPVAGLGRLVGGGHASTTVGQHQALALRGAPGNLLPPTTAPPPPSTTTAPPTTAPATTTTTAPPPPSTTTAPPTTAPATTTTTAPPPPSTTTSAVPPSGRGAPGPARIAVGQATWYPQAAPGSCASPTLAFGTVVQVVDVTNGSQITCVVDDREPDNAGRVLDLSVSGFSQLAQPAQGVVTVRVTWTS